MEKERLLNWADKALLRFVVQNAGAMPGRFVKLIANYYPDARVRKLYLRRLGVVMGKGTFANLGLRIAAQGPGQKPKVVIGSHVSIGPNVCFVADSCANNGTTINTLPYVKGRLTKSGRIVVKDNAWLGANVTLLPGVTVGECAVVGAGSVVSRDVEPYSVWAGVPARKIRDLRSGERVKGQ